MAFTTLHTLFCAAGHDGVSLFFAPFHPLSQGFQTFPPYNAVRVSYIPPPPTPAPSWEVNNYTDNIATFPLINTDSVSLSTIPFALSIPLSLFVLSSPVSQFPFIPCFSFSSSIFSIFSIIQSFLSFFLSILSILYLLLFSLSFLFFLSFC